MNIITKRAYRFTLYNGMERVNLHDVEPHVISNVPDWVTKDPLFNMALKGGNISIVGNTGEMKLDAVSALVASAKEHGITNPGTMTLDQLRQAIDEAKAGGKGPEDTKPPADNGDGKPPAEDDEELEPLTDKPLAEKSFGEMRTLAGNMGITVPRGTNTEGLRTLLAANGAE